MTMIQVSAVFGLYLLVPGLLACTIDLIPGARHQDKTQHESVEQKIYYSDAVILGKATGNITGAFPFARYPGMYTVRFETLCAFKGGAVSRAIYIAGLGNYDNAIPECPQSTVQFDRRFYQLMFLKSTGTPDVYEVEYKPMEIGYRELSKFMKDEVSDRCGLTFNFEPGTACMRFVPKEEASCIRYTPPAMPTTQPPVVETDPPVPQTTTPAPTPAPVETTTTTTPAPTTTAAPTTTTAQKTMPVETTKEATVKNTPMVYTTTPAAEVTESESADPETEETDVIVSEPETDGAIELEPEKPKAVGSHQEGTKLEEDVTDKPSRATTSSYTFSVIFVLLCTYLSVL